jgi:DUF4097 and DUF4098 domain-containing protein YvlB
MPEYPAAGPIHATVRISTGDLRIAAENRQTVEVTVTPGTSSEASRTAAAETRVEMVGDELVVETPQARGFVIRRTPPVNIAIRLPLDSRLTLRSASADMVVDGRVGDTDINTASGDVRLDHVAGHLRRNAASGDLQFDRVDGEVQLATASGDVRAGTVGGDLSAKSASGDITLDAVGGSARVVSASGDVKLGNLATGDTRIHTASGDVLIGVNQGTAVWMDMSSSSGDTRSELAVGNVAPVDSPATLQLRVRTASGDITIRRAVTAAARGQVGADTPRD